MPLPPQKRLPLSSAPPVEFVHPNSPPLLCIHRDWIIFYWNLTAGKPLFYLSDLRPDLPDSFLEKLLLLTVRVLPIPGGLVGDCIAGREMAHAGPL
jgi:hypothetical protein